MQIKREKDGKKMLDSDKSPGGKSPVFLLSAIMAWRRARAQTQPISTLQAPSSAPLCRPLFLGFCP